jgi:hypothetical protein
MSCQQQFLEKFGGRHLLSKSSIWALWKKLETKGTLLDKHTGGHPKMNAGFGSEWDTLYKIKSRQKKDTCSLEEKEIQSKLHHMITQADRNIG